MPHGQYKSGTHAQDRKDHNEDLSVAGRAQASVQFFESEANPNYASNLMFIAVAVMTLCAVPQWVK
jgi:hypothetical protein